MFFALFTYFKNAFLNYQHKTTGHRKIKCVKWKLVKKLGAGSSEFFIIAKLKFLQYILTVIFVENRT